MIPAMTIRFGTVLLTATLFALTPRIALAQDISLSEILTRLIQADVRLAPADPNSGFASHDAHFIPGEDQRLAPFFFNQSILSQLSTFPVGSSSGGFSYSFDPALGTFVRTTDTFGPTFAERAVTIGRNRFNLGLSYQHVSYGGFEGEDLDSGAIKFYLTHEALPTASFFEGDVIETALRLKLTTDTVAMFGNYGITDRLDIGVAVPFVHVNMDAAVDATVLRLASGDRSIHVFVNGTTQETIRQSGNAMGIGDILLRAKYQVTKSASGGMAAAVDLRLPSGDDRNLLGAGATQIKANLIGSAPIGRVAPHFNVGYTWSEGASASGAFNVSDEVNYAAGTEVQAHPRLTMLVGVSGRTLRKAGRLQLQEKTFRFTTGPANDPTTTSGSRVFSEFAWEPGNLNLTVASAGIKFNPYGNLLISVNVLVPVGDAGIKARPTPIIGLDYVF
jgi:hypothetical protein